MEGEVGRRAFQAGKGPRIRKGTSVTGSLGIGHQGSTVQKVRDVNLKYWEGGEPGGRNRL